MPEGGNEVDHEGSEEQIFENSEKEDENNRARGGQQAPAQEQQLHNQFRSQRIPEGSSDKGPMKISLKTSNAVSSSKGASVGNTTSGQH